MHPSQESGTGQAAHRGLDGCGRALEVTGPEERARIGGLDALPDPGAGRHCKETIPRSWRPDIIHLDRRVPSPGRRCGAGLASNRSPVAGVAPTVNGLDPRAVAMLGETIVGQLSFVGLDGYPRVVPVWFDYRDGEILISNAPGTYKCRCIGTGARIGFAI